MGKSISINVVEAAREDNERTAAWFGTAAGEVSVTFFPVVLCGVCFKQLPVFKGVWEVVFGLVALLEAFGSRLCNSFEMIFVCLA